MSQDVDRLFVVEPVFVDADDDLFAPSTAACRRVAASSISRFGRPVCDRLGHAAQRLDLLDQRPGLFGQLGGQALDVVGAGQRIDDLGDAGLVLQDQLGVAGDARREFGRQRDRLVEGIGVQRLGAAERGRHRLDRRCG